MKGFSSLTLGLLMAARMAVGPQAGAQTFGLSVTPSASPILVSNSLTYTINVTNLAGINLTDVFVTNTLPASVQFQNATTSQGTYTPSGHVVLFNLGSFSYPGIAQLTVTAEPTVVGSITNTVTVASPADFTNTVSASVAVQVTNVPPALADLGVTMTGPRQVVITNDWMTYGVSVTNAGPNAASSVMLTNTLPTGVIPITLANRTGSSNYIYKLGTLAGGGDTNLFFTVEPTNAGALPFLASVGSGATDTNSANNTNSITVTVTNYFPGSFTTGIISNQVYNPQNGLMEQLIAVTNVGTNVPYAVRVVVTGLTNGLPNPALANAVGTNAGNPFVVFAGTLETNQSVNLLMQYYTPTRSAFPFTNSQLHPFAVSMPNLTPPAPAGVSTNLNIYRILPLANGNVLLEWPAITNRTYTVVYSDNASFSNAMIAPPSIKALGNRLQWVDYGPPTTVSLPTNTARFYRVYQNP